MSIVTEENTISMEEALDFVEKVPEFYDLLERDHQKLWHKLICYIDNSTLELVEGLKKSLKENIDLFSDKLQRNTVEQQLNRYQENGLQNIEQHIEEEVQKQQAARQQYIDALYGTTTTE